MEKLVDVKCEGAHEARLELCTLLQASDVEFSAICE